MAQESAQNHNNESRKTKATLREPLGCEYIYMCFETFFVEVLYDKCVALVF